MKLYIVRHGLAGEHGDPRYLDDRLRPLTDDGRKRFSNTAKALAATGVKVSLIATSPLVRCRQTAEILAERLPGKPKLVEIEALVPGSDLNALIDWTNNQAVSEVAWVGHAPDVNDLTGHLIARGYAQIRFAKGALAAIEFDDLITRGGGELQWLVTAKVLGC
jgi:phosphohistidine phosphatase